MKIKSPNNKMSQYRNKTIRGVAKLKRCNAFTGMACWHNYTNQISWRANYRCKVNFNLLYLILLGDFKPTTDPYSFYPFSDELSFDYDAALEKTGLFLCYLIYSHIVK